MNTKKNQLLKILHDSESPLPIKTLAAWIHTSERTVRNYIKEINAVSDSTIIEKTGANYFFKANSSLEHLLDDEENSTTYREKTILHKLLTHTTTTFSTFDVAEELFISFSTLRNIISHINEEISSYDLKVISRNNYLYLKGPTKQRRRLLADIIHQEASHSLYSYNQLVNYFDSQFVHSVNAVLDRYLDYQNYVLNDIAKFNILVHFLILLSLVQENGNSKHQTPSPSPLENEIQTHLNLYPPQEELQLLEDMILINAKQSSGETHQSEQLLVFVNDLTAKLNAIYSIEMQNDAFKEGLALHLTNLISRINRGRSSRNPLTETIIKQSPLIFDIATTCAIIICKQFHWSRLPKDEIAYLALHIGLEIGRSPKTRHRIQTLLITPGYSSIDKNLSANIQAFFDKDIIISKTLADGKNIGDEEAFDLIINCGQFSSLKTEVVTISPFFDTKDSNKIANAIEKVLYKQRIALLMQQFDHYFSSDNFYIYENSNLPNDYQEMVSYLCDQIINKTGINPKFKEKIFEREAMASTIFNRIAIPHQFSYFPKKSIILVVVAKNGLKWNGTETKLMLLPCISEADRKEFNYFYETLLEVFDNDFFLKNLTHVNNFNDFKSSIH